MKDEHTRTLNAARAGLGIMDEVLNAPLWNTKTAVKNKHDGIAASADKMEDIDDEITDPEGSSTAKTQAKIKAATTAWQLDKPLKIFARDKGLTELEGEIDFSWTNLRYGKAQTLIDNWSLVQERAAANSVALIADGYIDGALIPQLLLDIDAFKTARPKPKAAQANIKSLNNDLEKEWNKLKGLITEMTELLVQFAVSKETFYNACIEAFDEDETGVRHKSLEVTYEDENTAVLIEGVAATILEKQLTKKSSKKIGVVTFMLQETGQGNLTLESKHPLYVSQTSPNLAVKSGELLKLRIKLKKVV